MKERIKNIKQESRLVNSNVKRMTTRVKPSGKVYKRNKEKGRQKESEE